MSNFTAEEKQILLNIVDQSIQYGLQNRQPLPIDLDQYSQHLQEKGASFVTLEIGGKLRGCIGSLEAYRSLVIDIADNAFAAAFRDPRFFPLTEAEYPQLTKHISVLTKPVPLAFNSEEDLLNKIRPQIDGLILSERGARGTFLPSVWESLPASKDFLRHLKMKAGLPPDYWSDTIQIERYTAEVI